jgi:hypothetical protein
VYCIKPYYRRSILRSHSRPPFIPRWCTHSWRPSGSIHFTKVRHFRTITSVAPKCTLYFVHTCSAFHRACILRLYFYAICASCLRYSSISLLSVRLRHGVFIILSSHKYSKLTYFRGGCSRCYIYDSGFIKPVLRRRKLNLRYQRAA